MMRVGIAADQSGFVLIQELLVQLREADHNVVNFGAHNRDVARCGSYTN